MREQYFLNMIYKSIIKIEMFCKGHFNWIKYNFEIISFMLLYICSEKGVDYFMRVRKITLSALCLTISILLPQTFHLIGFQQVGSIFLPMHLPIFISGMILGPIYGCLVGILAPFISFLLTGMPTAQKIFIYDM